MNISTFSRPALARWSGLFAVLSLATLALVTFSASAGGASKSPPAVFDVPATTRSFADVVEMVSPSVVAIVVTKEAEALPTSTLRGQIPGRPGTPFDDFFGRFFDVPGGLPRSARPVQGQGSGFVIDQSGYIVTNNHVVEHASSVSVLLLDGRELDAKLIGTDPKTDLALLKVESKDAFSALTFGDSDKARVGDWVLAIGNPFGLGGSATAGIISARGRDIRSGPYDDFLQIDAPINSGNSGGPVFNADGEVIGVNTAIFSPNGGNVGIGFAIPSKQVEAIVAELQANGAVRRGWLGVQIQDINDELASSLGLENAAGALIADVVDESPAFDAGLKVGDVIVQFGDDQIKSAKSLSLAVADTDPSHKVPVKIIRERKVKTVHVKLGEAEQVAGGPANSPANSSAAGGELGLSLAELTDVHRRQLGLADEVSGVLVRQVKPGSSAAKQGIQAGDVISRIGQTPVKSVADAKAAIAKAGSAGSHAALLVKRRDGQRFVSVALS